MVKKEESSKKVFDKNVFEKVKKMQAQKTVPTLEQMAERIGFGLTTVRKALAAPTWAQYRKNHLTEMRKRAEKRLATREKTEDIDAVEMSSDDEPVAPFLETDRDPLAERAHLAEKEAKRKRNREIITWVIAVGIIVVTLVLLLIVKH